MRKHVLFFWFVLFVAPAFGQNNIKKSAAVTYTQGPPTYTVLLPSSSEIAVDTTTGKIYQFHRTTSTWLQLGQGIDVISGSIPPAYTPARNQSIFAINAVDSLYQYRSGAWRHLNAGGGLATTNGHVFAGNGTPVAQKDTADFINNDIQFSVSNASTRTQVIGTIAADSVNSTHIQAGAVGNSELASNAVDSSKICAGCVSVTDIGQHGATSGQVLKWNGTQWAAAADNNTGTIVGPGSANQIAFFSDTTTISSSSNMTYDGSFVGFNVPVNRTKRDRYDLSYSTAFPTVADSGHFILNLADFPSSGSASRSYGVNKYLIRDSPIIASTFWGDDIRIDQDASPLAYPDVYYSSGFNYTSYTSGAGTNSSYPAVGHRIKYDLRSSSYDAQHELFAWQPAGHFATLKLLAETAAAASGFLMQTDGDIEMTVGSSKDVGFLNSGTGYIGNTTSEFTVGINTSSPSQSLDVNGTTRLRDHLFDQANSSGSTGQYMTRGGSGPIWATLSVDSTKIANGGISVTDIGQHGASSGQGLTWNGTQWAPASVTSDDIPLDHIPIGTGTALTYDYAIQANRTATDGQEAKIRLSMKDAGTSDHAIVIDSVLSTNTAYVVDITNPSTSAGSGFFFPYRARYTGSAAVDLYSVLSSSSTDSGADVFLSIGAASGGGDPSIAWSSGVTNNLVIAGIDNSSTGDLWKVDYLTTGSNMDGTYAIGVDNANRVGIGGDPVTGKALTVTGEARISDLTVTSFTPVDIVAAESDGDLGRLKIGSNLSISNDTLHATASGTVDGTGAAGQVAYWSDSNTITGEDSLFYNSSTNRLGVNTNVPDNKVTVKTNTATDGIQIESDGTAGQDPGWVRFKATQTGPLTQYGWMTLDGDSPAEGQGYIFKLQTTGYSVHTPLSLFKNQAIFAASSAFTISNNAAGRFIFSVPSAYDHNFKNNVLVTGSTFTTADTTIRLSVVGRTQTSASWGLRVWDGNKQSVFQVRDDSRVGITATTLDASLTINGAGATSGTYGLMVTPSGGTTTTGTLIVRDDNRVGIRTNAPQAPLNVVGTGTGSGTTALLVEGSGGQDNLNVRDDGVNIGQGFAMASSAPSIAFASAAGTGPVNDLCAGGANGFVLFFTTGTSPGTNAAIFTATLPKSYPNGVIATWSCGDTDCLDEAPDIYISGTGNNSVTLSTRGTLTASTAYVIYVTCFGY